MSPRPLPTLLLLLLCAGTGALTSPLTRRLAVPSPRGPSTLLLAAKEACQCLEEQPEGTTDPPVEAKPLSRALGYAMSLGALGMFVPIIMRIISTRSVAGFSQITWGMQIVGYAAFMTYPVRSGYALSTYVEYICLMAQSLTINCLMRLYSGVSPVSVCAGALAFGVGLVAALRTMPMPAAKLCVPLATCLLSTSLLPQIMRNFVTHSSGGWSSITAILGVIGNTIRLYTTFQLANGDRLLLLQFGTGTILNLTLLGQVLAWGS
eukprot:scaffold183212_cov33-Tisochrysis_lutea.AAC.1